MPDGGAPDRAPVSAAEFFRLMDRLGPFEARPRLAVGVSGGRDSMVLVLLAADWVRAQDGELLALTVDHGLRSESVDEARQVARWMAGHSIPHRVLRLTGLNRTRAVEAAARAARYEALEHACREAGILHLLVGHHLSDQVETRIMRRARSSGVAGQAGMADLRESGGVRILRPLLSVPRARLSASLAACGQSWIEDPSNLDPRFERARLRAGAAISNPADSPSSVAARIAHERALASLAGAVARIDPAGFAVLDSEKLRSAAPDTARDLIGRAVTTVSGGAYPPRGARLDALAARVVHDTGDWRRTLGGCVITHVAFGRLQVFREPAALPPPCAVGNGAFTWDNRFTVLAGSAGPGLTVDALERASRRDWARVVSARVLALPHEARRVLPGLYDGDRLAAGPDFDGQGALFVRFSPKNPISGATFGGF